MVPRTSASQTAVPVCVLFHPFLLAPTVLKLEGTFWTDLIFNLPFQKKKFAITIMIYSSNHKWGRLVTLTCLIWCLKFVINSFCWTNRCSSTQFLVCLTVQVLPRRASKVNLKQLLQCSRSPGTNPRRLNRNFRAGNVADACSFFCRSIT